MKQKILLIVLFTVLLAGSVQAGISDTVFDKLGDFLHAYDTETIDGTRGFAGSYSNERMIIDGLLFFILFLSLSIMGLRKWYGQSTPAINGIAISLSALMTISLMTYTEVTIGLLFPFAKNILFFIMWLIVFSIINKNVVSGKAGAFILSLLLTLAMFHAEGLIEDTAKGEKYSFWDTTKKAVDPTFNKNNWETKEPVTTVPVTTPQTTTGMTGEESESPPTTTTNTGNNCKGPYGDKVDCRKITDCPTATRAQHTGTYPAVDGNTYYYIPQKCSGAYSSGYCCYSENPPGTPTWTVPGKRGTSTPSTTTQTGTAGIKQIQELLKAAGYNVKTDGVLDQGTVNFIKATQNAWASQNSELVKIKLTKEDIEKNSQLLITYVNKQIKAQAAGKSL